MTAPPDLARCAHCKGWFAAAAGDEVFFHATRRCRRVPVTAAVPRGGELSAETAAVQPPSRAAARL